MFGDFDHVGYLVRDLDAAVELGAGAARARRSPAAPTLPQYAIGADLPRPGPGTLEIFTLRRRGAARPRSTAPSGGSTTSPSASSDLDALAATLRASGARFCTPDRRRRSPSRSRVGPHAPSGRCRESTRRPRAAAQRAARAASQQTPARARGSRSARSRRPRAAAQRAAREEPQVVRARLEVALERARGCSPSQSRSRQAVVGRRGDQPPAGAEHARDLARAARARPARARAPRPARRRRRTPAANGSSPRRRPRTPGRIARARARAPPPPRRRRRPPRSRLRERAAEPARAAADVEHPRSPARAPRSGTSRRSSKCSGAASGSSLQRRSK